MFATQLTSMMLLLAEAASLNPSRATEDETQGLIGLFVALGMAVLILKGFLIARWFANREASKRLIKRAQASAASHRQRIVDDR